MYPLPLSLERVVSVSFDFLSLFLGTCTLLSVFEITSLVILEVFLRDRQCQRASLVWIGADETLRVEYASTNVL